MWRVPVKLVAPAAVRDILLRIRARLERPESWCQMVEALDADGRDIDPERYPERVARCCILGACWAEGRCGGEAAIYLATLIEDDYAARAFSVLNALAYWNDRPERTHADVLALLDRAIEEASA